MCIIKIASGAKPDPCAIAIAREVHRAVQPDVVILYGSRARGDHRLDSDVDLIVILTGTPGTRPKPLPSIPASPYDVNILVRDLDWFQRCRRARNHVAVRTMRGGVVIGGNVLDVSVNTDDGYPDGWPDVKDQLQWTYDHIRLIAHADGASPAVRGECARKAMEHALRAWISAVDLDYPITRNITELGDIITSSRAEGTHPVVHDLRRFLASIRNPNDVAGADILTQFAVNWTRWSPTYTIGPPPSSPASTM